MRGVERPRVRRKQKARSPAERRLAAAAPAMRNSCSMFVLEVPEE